MLEKQEAIKKKLELSHIKREHELKQQRDRIQQSLDKQEIKAQERKAEKEAQVL